MQITRSVVRSSKRLRRCRREGAAGFSLVEAMVTAAILGIGLIGVIKMHTSGQRGVHTVRDLSVAEDVATQASEELAAVGMAGLDGHPCTLLGAPTGCRNGTVMATLFTAPKATGCTNWVDERGLMRDATGAAPTIITDETTALGAGRRFRIDTVVRRHPDPSQDVGTRVIDIFVCWRDERGAISEIQKTRVVAR